MRKRSKPQPKQGDAEQVRNHEEEVEDNNG
jgi:hypothetical protein